SRDLETLLRQALFREDLYYRLNVVPLFIPPLRDRREDIPELVDHFREKLCRETGKTVALSQDAVVALANYPWPGNVRELENVIERTVVMTGRRMVEVDDLKLMPAHPPSGPGPAGAAPDTLTHAVEDIEAKSIRDALVKTGWRQAAAARLLGITPRQIGYKIRKYGIAVPVFDTKM
ncbi:MAG TPA: helix-turn-helix domain-containing protein, partial [Nitrospirota bacterium]|nr:helix-turn-helix domain-containing protein [Nitrospirota bacterium]